MPEIREGEVGLVLGSTTSTTQEFRVVLHEDEYLQLDDLVVVRTHVPKIGEVATYGIVTEVEAEYEGTQFASDTRRVAVDGTLPAEKSRTAVVQVVRVLPELWVAPDSGQPVLRATGAERERALYVDEMGSGGVSRALPVGLTRDDEPVWADVDFFDGTKGAHMSISGVSGVATKTSYALFFLRCLTSHPEILGKSAKNLRVLIFNVKGEDLMFLDKPNRNLGDEARSKWTRLGIEPAPFPSVSFWAPESGREGIPRSGARMEGVQAYRWTPREFVDRNLLPLLFTDAQDVRQQLTFVGERVARQLRRWANDVAGEEGALVLRDPFVTGEDPPGPVVAKPGERVVRNLHDLVEAIGEYLEPENGLEEADQRWTGRAAGGTVSAFMRRLYGAVPRVGDLVRAGPSRLVDRTREAVTVVDIHQLHEAAQRFVVGALIQEVHDEKEGRGRFPLSVIVLDELNKYAPRDGWSPIRDTLVDIAQRGRSLGVILIGAQQSASRVDPDVLSNASLRVSGRLDAAEAERAEYGWMLPSTRARARLLKPGTMVLSQPAIPAPTMLTFPYPPWATRPEEAAPEADPFEGL
ncbi:MAG TPA: ATP-binding protein [Actinomycetota bacterium]|nr:ATP-binding protein [Actinomycetota bacterium]